MKTLQVKINSENFNSKDIQKIKEINPHVVFLFGSPNFFEEKHFGSLYDILGTETKLIGCSTSGEIVSEGVAENCLTLTGLHFDGDTTVREAQVLLQSPSEVEKAGEEIGRKLSGPDLKSIFILGLGVNFNGSSLIKGIKRQVQNNVIITGGLAGDNGLFEKTFTLAKGQFSDSSVVAVGFYGEEIEVGYGSIGGWQSFGPVRKVTRAEGNVLYEIDGRSALEIYKKYLGDKAKDLPRSGLLYPIAILNPENPDSIGLIRTLLNINEDEGSLILAGDIPSEAIIRLMYSRSEGLINGAKEAAEHALSMTHESLSSKQESDNLALLVSCVGRKLALGDETEEEVLVIREVLGSQSTLSGFYSYGEICPYNTVEDCRLHNQTMTVTFLREKQNKAA